MVEGARGPLDRSLDLLGQRLAELLLPPVRLLLVELALELADVRGELTFLLAEPFLELRDLQLPPLELLLAELEVGLDARFARLDFSLALVDLADPIRQRLLGGVQPLLTPLQPFALGLNQCLARAELALAGGQLALTLEQRLLLVLELLGLAFLPLDAAERRELVVELGLAGRELDLELVQPREPRPRLLVELPDRDLPGLERPLGGAQRLLTGGELVLAVLDRLLARRQPAFDLRQLALLLEQL